MRRGNVPWINDVIVRQRPRRDARTLPPTQGEQGRGHFRDGLKIEHLLSARAPIPRRHGASIWKDRAGGYRPTRSGGTDTAGGDTLGAGRGGTATASVSFNTPPPAPKPPTGNALFDMLDYRKNKSG